MVRRCAGPAWQLSVSTSKSRPRAAFFVGACRAANAGSETLSVRAPNENSLEEKLFQAIREMVRLAGIEPTTPWFVAKYSIQLSYSRAALNSTLLKALFRRGFQKSFTAL